MRGPRGEFGALGVVDVERDADAVFRFMAAIEEQPRWHDGVKRSRVVAREGHSTLHVQQTLVWKVFALNGAFDLLNRVVEDKAGLRITTEMVRGGAMMRRFSSDVVVQRTGPRCCRLQMAMYMQPNLPVPLGCGALVGGQVRRQLHGVLTKARNTLHEEEHQQKQKQQGGLFGGFGGAFGSIGGGAGGFGGNNSVLGRPAFGALPCWLPQLPAGCNPLESLGAALRLPLLCMDVGGA